MNNGPEDLFLEELVRNLKWKAAQQKQQQEPVTYFRQRQQQQPQLTDIRLLEEEEDDDYAEQDDKVLFQPRIDQPFQQHQEQKNFAYRPHDDRFHNNQQHRPVPVEPVRQIKTINPLIQPAGMNLFLFSFAGQKKPFCEIQKVAEYNSPRIVLFNL